MCQSSCQQVSGTSLGMMASRALFYTAGAVLVPSRWSGRDGFQMSCASAINHDWPINHQPSTSTRLYSSFWWWHIFLPVTSRILLRSSQPLSLTQNVVGVFWCVSNCCWLIKFKISDVRRRLHTVHWFDSNKKKRGSILIFVDGCTRVSIWNLCARKYGCSWPSVNVIDYHGMFITMATSPKLPFNIWVIFSCIWTHIFWLTLWRTALFSSVCWFNLRQTISFSTQITIPSGNQTWQWEILRKWMFW